ncbi:MAG: acetyltransferase [Candidatus Latescibacteria bacterium]|nr:acetyltransferase [Candidatus Latescibacterota bacterium]
MDLAHPTGEPVSAEKKLAEVIREACVRAALEGYERAGISGLCHEGAWECAVDAIRSLDLEALIRTLPDA